MTTVPPLEIELKLVLPPGQVGAFRKRMARRRAAPAELDLVTRYFDTPDFALSQAGVALRVRRTLKGTSAGRRWLQTLKTEGERRGGLSQRVEFEMPVKTGALDWTRFPPEALAYVPEALREQVVPVFETRFHRTAWQLKGRRGAAVEVALDVGEIRSGERSQPLCEVELELKSGQPDALFDLALDWAGAFGCLPFDVSKAERGVCLAHGQEAAPVKAVAPVLGAGMRLEEGFAAIVQSCLTQFQANLPGLRDSAEVEYLHQARVALRRLRAALRLYRRVCVVPDDLLAGLRALVVALGPVRDWDVLCGETLAEMAPHFRDEAVWSRGMAALQRQRADARAAMLEALGQAKPGAWLLAFQRWILRGGWHEAETPQQALQSAALLPWARRVLRKGQRRLEAGARDFAELSPTQRHALRVAVKRQRYATEFFQGLLHPRRTARYLAALCALQDSLGRANDARVAMRLLDVVHAQAGPMADFARGWLAARLAGDGDAATVSQLQKFVKLRPGW